MRRLLSDMARRYRVRRSNARLARLMQKAPRPVPPEGLRERLIEQAPALGYGAVPTPTRLRRWIVWGIPAAVLVVMIALVSWSVVFHSTRNGHETTSAKAPVAGGPDGAKPETPSPTPQVAATTHEQSDTAKSAPGRTARHIVRRTKPRSVAETGIVQREAEGIRVTVTTSRTEETGYAQAAAWGLDENGQAVKTRWTTVEGPSPPESQQDLLVAEYSGKRRSLTVAMVAPPHEDVKEPKGELSHD